MVGLCLPGAAEPGPTDADLPEDIEIQPEETPTPKEPWETEERALRWMQQRQAEDGHWGRGESSIALTSLAILSFFNHGETPASAPYGQTVERGLMRLVAYTKGDPTRLSEDERAILVWALAESFALTRIPALRQAVEPLAEPEGLARPTPWNALAGRALWRAGLFAGNAENSLARMRANLLESTQPDAALALYLDAMAGKEASARAELPRHLAGDWQGRDHPLVRLVILNHLALHVGAPSAFGGQEARLRTWTGSQIRDANTGWWTPEALQLEVRNLPEFAREDPELYLTAMVMITFPPPRFLPTFERMRKIPPPIRD